MMFKGIESYTADRKKPKQIKSIIMMGDSLSDRGTADKTLIFGCIPMSVVSGLSGRSPDGRFTNGLVWSDHVSAKIASDFTIKRLEKKWHLDDTDIADAIITKEKKVVHAIHDNYSLDNDKFITYYGKVWIRSYCIGGLMAYDYSWILSSSIVLFFTRLVVSSLAYMRKQVLDYDKAHHISYQQKAETLIIEWSGANDLVTVNAKPSIAEADRAIAARMDNIKKLIATGYRNFIAVNLPNVALTPRFQAKSAKEQAEAQYCSYYFNAELKKACALLCQEYPHCPIEEFDINSLFEQVYHNPEQYLFDSAKLKIPYSTSPDFNDPSDGISQSTGYMFYDDLHPTADLHALLADYFYTNLETHYELLDPTQDVKKPKPLSEESLLQSFRIHYERTLQKNQNGFFGDKKSRINYKHADLDTVLRHALIDGSQRTKSVLNKMGWVDKDGQLMLAEPVLQHAMNRIYNQHSGYNLQ